MIKMTAFFRTEYRTWQSLREVMLYYKLKCSDIVPFKKKIQQVRCNQDVDSSAQYEQVTCLASTACKKIADEHKVNL